MSNEKSNRKTTYKSWKFLWSGWKLCDVVWIVLSGKVLTFLAGLLGRVEMPCRTMGSRLFNVIQLSNFLQYENEQPFVNNMNGTPASVTWKWVTNEMVPPAFNSSLQVVVMNIDCSVKFQIRTVPHSVTTPPSSLLMLWKGYF